jgi:hypothetical protein
MGGHAVHIREVLIVQASNAGVPVSPPASRAHRLGPFAVWRGHPSPVPWVGKFSADAGFWYRISDRESEEAYVPVCHDCIVGLVYRFRGFCDLSWEHLTEEPRYCDWCDRRIR